MKKNRMYTHLAIRKDASGTFRNYEIYYAVDLEPGFYTTAIIPANTSTTADDDYTVPLDPNVNKNVIILKVSRGNGVDKVPRDGKIKIAKIPKRQQTDPHYVEFVIEDNNGPIGAEGKSTPHYGDAD
jgi:hypothetical protein